VGGGERNDKGEESRSKEVAGGGGSRRTKRSAPSSAVAGAIEIGRNAQSKREGVPAASQPRSGVMRGERTFMEKIEAQLGRARVTRAAKGPERGGEPGKGHRDVSKATSLAENEAIEGEERRAASFTGRGEVDNDVEMGEQELKPSDELVFEGRNGKLAVNEESQVHERIHVGVPKMRIGEDDGEGSFSSLDNDPKPSRPDGPNEGSVQSKSISQRSDMSRRDDDPDPSRPVGPKEGSVQSKSIRSQGSLSGNEGGHVPELSPEEWRRKWTPRRSERVDVADLTTPSRITSLLPPLRQITAREGKAGEGWYLDVDEAQVRKVEDGLKSCGLDMSAYLQSLVAEGRSCYQVGSEFCARADDEFAEVQNDSERIAMRETLGGARMKWKRGAEEAHLATWKFRATEAARRGRPPMGPGETRAFCESHEKDNSRGYILVVTKEFALTIVGLQISPCMVINQSVTDVDDSGQTTTRAKYRTVNDLTTRDPRLWKSSINFNTDTAKDPEMTIGTCFQRVVESAYALRRSRPEQRLVGIKYDIEGAFKRIHLYGGDVKYFAYMLDRDHVVLNLRLPMGWTRSPSLMCNITESVARKAALTRTSDIRLEAFDLARDYELGVVEEGELKTMPADTMSWFQPYEAGEGPRVQAYVDDSGMIVFADPCVMRTAVATFEDVNGRMWRIVSKEEGAWRPNIISDKKRIEDGRFHPIWTMLGNEINLDAMHVSVPVMKARRLLALLGEFEGERGSFDSLRRLTGKLNSVSLAVMGGKFFLRRLYNSIRDSVLEGELEDEFVIGADTKEEFGFWRAALARQRPVPIHSFIPRSATFTGASDACAKLGGGAGGYWRLTTGGITRDYCWTVKWPPSLIAKFRGSQQDEQPHHTWNINTGELVGCILNFEALIQILKAEGMYDRLAGSAPDSLCDNSSTVSWLKRYSSRCEKESELMLSFGKLCLEGEFFPQSHHVQGVLNVIADMLSRWGIKSGIFSGIASLEDACEWIRTNVPGSNPIPFHLTPQVGSPVQVEALLELLSKPYLPKAATPTATRIGCENGPGGWRMEKVTK
jgi:hypothetical protein